MNRKYKFRVWDTKSKEFISKDFELGDGDDGYIGHNSKNEMVYSEDCIFNQFTGLLDRNKVEIFENDVIRFYLANYQGKLSKEEVGEVKYSETLCHYYVSVPNNSYKPEHYLLSEINEIEVLGNSFENPELIEIKEKEEGNKYITLYHERI